MKKTLQHSVLVALTLTLLLPLRAFAQGKPESPLHTEMEGMNRSLRLINRQYTDLSLKTNTLELVATLQKHAETARTLTPPKADKLTGDDQTKYIDTFHNDLDALLKEIGLLKQAITADKTDAAKAEIDKIKQLEESSHKELGVGQGRKHGGPPPPASAPGQ
jgi:soluble cytochrome b562